MFAQAAEADQEIVVDPEALAEVQGKSPELHIVLATAKAEGTVVIDDEEAKLGMMKVEEVEEEGEGQAAGVAEADTGGDAAGDTGKDAEGDTGEDTGKDAEDAGEGCVFGGPIAEDTGANDVPVVYRPGAWWGCFRCFFCGVKSYSKSKHRCLNPDCLSFHDVRR